MAENSKIEWTDHTFNPWIGCTKVSPGCDHCYAEAREDKRLHRVQWGAGQPRSRTKTWGEPKKWNERHAEFFAAHGRHQRVFCASLADVFDNEVPTIWRVELFALIGANENLDFLLLTKRVGNVKKLIEDAAHEARERGMHATATWLFGWLSGDAPDNVWLGATVVNQEEADRDIPKLLAAPARVRFLSMEPLLGPVDITEHVHRKMRLGYAAGDVQAAWIPAVDWVIVGGESGPGARPIHVEWARTLRDQCAAAGVPFLFKQWGEWLPWSQFSDAQVDDPPEQTRFDTLEFQAGTEWSDVGHPGYWESMDGDVDDGQCVGRVGKKRAGRLLDGQPHDGFPRGSTVTDGVKGTDHG